MDYAAAVQDSLRVECSLEAPHELQLFIAAGMVEVLPLERADAVFCGDGALVVAGELIHRVEDPIANVTIASATSPGVIDPCGFVPAGGSCRQRQNLGETRIIGLEADLEADLAEFWGLSGSYLYSHGEVTDAPNQPALEGRRIAQVPEHQVAIGLTYDNPRFFGAQLQARYVDDQYEDDLNLRRLDDFIVVDLSAWKNITPGLDLFLGVENLFDETIQAGRSGDGLVTVGAPARIHVGLRLSGFNRQPSLSRNRTRLP